MTLDSRSGPLGRAGVSRSRTAAGDGRLAVIVARSNDDSAEFFASRSERLRNFAYRMLGSVEDARDVVQDVWVRWLSRRDAKLRDPDAWLVTVCTRLALNRLRSNRIRKKSYPGVWLPEPLIESVPDARSPAADARAELDDCVSIAHLLALEQLSPAERAAFLLHDVFDYSFARIAEVLEKTEVNVRRIASRARARIEAGRSRARPSAREHRTLLDAFFHAARNGEVDVLESLLARSVELHADGGGKASAAPRVLVGPRTVAKFLCGVWRTLGRDGTPIALERVWFNGAPALLVRAGGVLATAVQLEIDGGAVSRVFAHRNPDKLAAFAASGGSGAAS